VETLENQTAVSQGSHRPWKSPRDFHIPTAATPVLSFLIANYETCSRLRRVQFCQTSELARRRWLRLVAGYGLSGGSERPGFGCYFGGDALMNSWSILDYGDFERACATLEFVCDHQRAALLDWSRYPYGYYHADTTALYIFSASRYVTRSGDLDFLQASWLSVEKAYRYCVSALDDDGLLSNREAARVLWRPVF
jgi:glycogen debranching enzyme